MIDVIVSAVHVLLTTMGVLAAPETLSLSGIGVVAITLAVLAASVVVLAVVSFTGPAPGSSPPHPQRAIDASAPLTQSDPDAAGHPRPRAPQIAASAA